MRTSQSWKTQERVFAEMLGTTRVPSNGHPQADLELPGWSVEVKKTQTFPKMILLAMAQAVRNVMPGKRPVVLFAHARGRGYPVERYAVLRFEDFMYLRQMEERVDELSALTDRTEAPDTDRLGGGSGRAPAALGEGNIA